MRLSQETSSTSLVRAYYLSWVLALVFALSAVLAVILGVSVDYGRAERLAFAALNGAAAAGFGCIGIYLHIALTDKSARH